MLTEPQLLLVHCGATPLSPRSSTYSGRDLAEKGHYGERRTLGPATTGGSELE